MIFVVHVLFSWVFKIIQTVFHHVRMGIYHVGTDLETTEKLLNMEMRGKPQDFPG